jgi:DNA-binding NarL/FixJ family response regulator
MSKNILLIGDHALFIQSLASFLNQLPELKVVEQADAPTDVSDSALGEVDVAVFDSLIPERGKVQLIRDLREVAPNLPVVVMTSSHDPTVRSQTLEAGANQLLTADVGLEAFAEKVKRATHS